MASSALQVGSVETPEAIMSKDEFWQEYKNRPDFYGRPGNAVKGPAHYNDVNYKIAKFFGSSPENSFESAYEAYLDNVNNRNEAKAVQSARAWDEYMSSTAYSRAFKDLENAGVNPYLLLNNGSSPSTSVGSSSTASYKSSQAGTKNAQSNTKGRDFALILLAIARLAAAVA